MEKYELEVVESPFLARGIGGVPIDERKQNDESGSWSNGNIGH